MASSLWPYLNVTYHTANVAPSVSIVVPLNGSVYGTNESLELNFSASDSDDNLGSCWYSIDGEANIKAVREEVADVLICLTRVCFDCQIPISELMLVVNAKLEAIWVDDPAEVTAVTSGLTRKGRVDAPNSHS